MAIHRGAIVIAALVVAVALPACSVPGLWTFDSSGAASQAPSDGSFDAATYADGVWNSRVLPAVEEHAVEASTLIPAIADDVEQAASAYGVVAAEGGHPSFLIKGSGTVTAVDSSQPTGPVTVKLAGGAEVQISTGPVILGTALRDAVGIKFGEFTNQIDYANAASALNTKVKTDVVGGLDRASLPGKTVQFEGAFTLLQPDQITIVPVILKVDG